MSSSLYWSITTLSVILIASALSSWSLPVPNVGEAQHFHTQLTSYAQVGDMPKINELLVMHPNVDHQSVVPGAIDTATKFGHLHVAKELLPKLKQVDEKTLTNVLKAAIAKRDLKYLKDLVDKYQNVLQPESWNDVIEFADKNWEFEAVQFLVSKYNGKLKNNILLTSLLDYMEFGDLDSVKYLVNHHPVSTFSPSDVLLLMRTAFSVQPEEDGMEFAKYLVDKFKDKMKKVFVSAFKYHNPYTHVANYLLPFVESSNHGLSDSIDFAISKKTKISDALPLKVLKYYFENSKVAPEDTDKILYQLAQHGEKSAFDWIIENHEDKTSKQFDPKKALQMAMEGKRDINTKDNPFPYYDGIMESIHKLTELIHEKTLTNALKAAVEKGDLEYFTELLQKHQNLQPETWNDLLREAALKSPEFIKPILTKYEYNGQLSGKDLEEVLNAAAKQGNLELLTVLLQKHQNLNQETWERILVTASIFNKQDALLFLYSKYNGKLDNLSLFKLLKISTKNGDLELVKQLLKKHPAADSKFSPEAILGLIRESMNSQNGMELTKCFVEHYFVKMENALVHAILEGYADVAKQIQSLYSIDFATSIDFVIPIKESVSDDRPDMVVKYFLENSNVAPQDVDKALYHLAYYGEKSAFDWIIENHKDKTSKEFDPTKALQMAMDGKKNINSKGNNRFPDYDGMIKSIDKLTKDQSFKVIPMEEENNALKEVSNLPAATNLRDGDGNNGENKDASVEKVVHPVNDASLPTVGNTQTPLSSYTEPVQNSIPPKQEAKEQQLTKDSEAKGKGNDKLSFGSKSALALGATALVGGISALAMSLGDSDNKHN